MHQAKMQRYDNKDLGMQIGACVNKAVDLTIAEFGEGLKTLGKPNIEKQIIMWTDILFKIGTDKKIKETTPQPVDLDKAEKQGEEFKKNVLEAERIEVDSKLEDINKEAQLGAEEIPVIEE